MAVKDEHEVAAELLSLLKEDTKKTKTLSLEELYSVQMAGGHTLLTAKSFEDMKLKKELLNAIYAQNIEKPSIIQSLAIPHILAGHNLVFQSRSGTGKTIAFTLSSLNKAAPDEGPQIIIITPTRELCIQVGAVVAKLAQSVNLKVCLALSNFVATSVSEEIVVGCPGKILGLLSKKIIDPKNVKMLVLDEADELISYQTFSVQTLKLLKTFASAQKILFSATYSEYSQRAAKTLIKECDTFFEKNTAAEKIMFYYLDLGTVSKIDALKELLSYLTVAQVIVFCNTRRMVEIVSDAMRRDQHSVSAIHGKLETSVRDSVFEKFARAETKILVATDVFSRGMDIPQVNLIINFDLPGSMSDSAVDSYIHRVGRSGRFNRSGFVVDLISSDEELNELVQLQGDADVSSKRFTLAALKKAFADQELASIENKEDEDK